MGPDNDVGHDDSEDDKDGEVEAAATVAGTGKPAVAIECTSQDGEF